eukprot:s109_g12.t1
MGPFAMVLRPALLCIPLAALRSGERFENLQLDSIATKASETSERKGSPVAVDKITRRLLQDVGYTGLDLVGPYCQWPGIRCTALGEIRKLKCHTCSGELPDHINLEWLSEVVLTSPNLTGDIKVFAGLKQLRVLDLHGTRVTGDIQIFRRTHFLTSLSLQNTKVFGDLEALNHPFDLQEIDLSFTKVTGTLESLMGESDTFGRWSAKRTYLSTLKLAGTEVLGNLKAITGSIRIRDVDLSHTRVVGQLSGGWVEKCKELEILRLRNSSVQFAPKGKVYIPDLPQTGKTRTTGMLPQLKELDLTDCPVNSPVENLLAPLLMSSPTSIKAANAGLTGMVPNLKEVPDGETPKAKTLPLAKRLLMLDLTQNDVKELRDLPVVPNLGRILLRENLELKVAPRLVTEALKQNIFLDLEGTKVSNTRDVARLLEKGAVKVTDMYAERNDTAGYACRDLVGTVRVTPAKFLPQTLCKCLPGWHGHGATCQMCPADKFSDEMGFDTCKSCPANSTAPEGCLPPDVSRRCPGSHQCGLGYSGTLCTSCADGFRASRGKCKPCGKSSSFPVGRAGLVLLGTAALLVAAFLAYRYFRSRGSEVQVSHASVASLLKKLAVLEAPILLQMVQLWTVLSGLGQRSESRRSLPEIPYLAAFQLTLDDFQASLSLQCTFDAETVRTVAALSSPLLPLFLLTCCATLELCRAGLGVKVALKVLPFLFVGGAYSTANLLTCQFEDGDGENLGDFAFRKALPQLRCYDRTGIGFWVDAVGCGSALAYGVLIPLGLAGLMVRQSFALQEAQLFYSRVGGELRHIELRLETMLTGHLVKEAFPKRLLAAAAAYMAVHCRGKRLVRLHDGYITTTSSEDEDTEEIKELSVVKASQLHTLSCVCLAVASVAFAYDFALLARVALLAPLLLLLWQAPPGELESELPKLQQGESHEAKMCLAFGRDIWDMGPFAMVLRLALLCIPLAALRSGERFEHLASTGDECDEEARQTRRLLQALGFTGPLNENHCDLPGITCAWKTCRVETLECATCSGHLPERIHLKHLKEVSLTSPTLSGDIKTFEGTPQLEKLELKGKVSGDIQVFQEMKHLNWLSLANTKVTGHLQVVEKLKYLTSLSLSDTQVVGDLSSMAGARRIKLDLSGTGVTGNLSDLIGHLYESGASRNMGQLQVLKLSRTKVTGDLGDLRPCKELRELDLSYTEVVGRMQKHWIGWFRLVRILQLRNSSVQFVPKEEDLKTFRDQWTFYRPFQMLADLDLTHCPVNDSVENLLVVLVALGVTSIKAVGAGISGALPRVTDLQVTVDGEALLRYEAS